MKQTVAPDTAQRKPRIAALLAELVDLIEVERAERAPVDEEPLIDAEDAAERMKCSRPTAKATLERCGAPIYMVGDHRRWKWSEVCAALKSMPQPSRVDTEIGRLGVTKLSRSA